MVRRASRSELPPDPAATILALRACRAAMVGVCGRVKPMGVVYHGAAMVMAAIDGFAVVLTGHRHYFHAGGSTINEGRREILGDRDARERGEKPWV